MDNLQEQILDILDSKKIGSMVTVKGDKPYARYMTFTNRGFKLYTMTEDDSSKVLDLENNPHTHILFGYTESDADAPYLEIEGKVTDFIDDELKLKVTNFLRGVMNDDAHDMITLEIEPTCIRLMNKQGQPPQELTFPLS
ncbi:pyridoxamine 5'-phosphate oxidase family protein [Lysinibacillus sp. LZ02]|uniref:pyridoxamine 5'-phosphate oxidase family protein n=1 Tax=Lysinibacillus sp. LZ02 TaxID=3420668 RepID=UPI003D361647